MKKIARMYKFLVLAAALMICVTSAPHHEHDHEHDHAHEHENQGGMGPAEELDVSSPDVLNRLKRALEAAKFNGATVKKINKATAQKVEGVAYTMEFYASNDEHCVAKWAEEPWVSSSPEHVTVNCH